MLIRLNPKPRPGDRRARRRFLLFPLYLMGEARWLECATVVEVYVDRNRGWAAGWYPCCFGGRATPYAPRGWYTNPDGVAVPIPEEPCGPFTAPPTRQDIM